MTDDEPTRDQIESLLDRYASQHRGEVDEDRIRFVLERVMEAHPMATEIREMAELGASFSMERVGDQIRLWLGFPDDAKYQKVRGKGVDLGRFAADELRPPPQG
jgi:hypothetical protein